jgi:DNA replication and repair protein RecF
MTIQSISLQNFRNYTSRSLQFSPGTTVLVGPNAIGKTAIVEAVHALATGNSFRAGITDEMITFDQELGRVKGIVNTDSEELELELLLTRGIVQGKKTQKRLYSINGTRRSKRKFVGNLLTVVFRPEDMRLIEGSPARRRDFLDTPLQLLSAEYQQSLSTYGKALVRRNKLLTHIREGEVPRSVLTYWTMTILKHGQLIQEHRRQFIESFQTVDFPLNFRVEYDVSVISEERLAYYAEREIAAGHTLVGPHKDDIHVFLEDHDVAVYGSRGQQRMAVLWLKQGELAYVTQQAGHRPVLLLDDILSELDEVHEGVVLEQLNKGQAIVTSAHAQISQLISKAVGDVTTIVLD